MAQAVTRSLLNTSALPLMWCAGCGNGIVLNALLCALDELQMKKEDVLIVTGIGCWGKADDYISANALHTTHGRALTYATGAKAAITGMDWLAMALICFVLPAVLAWLFGLFFRRIGWIREGDLTLE